SVIAADGSRGGASGLVTPASYLCLRGISSGTTAELAAFSTPQLAAFSAPRARASASSWSSCVSGSLARAGRKRAAPTTAPTTTGHVDVIGIDDRKASVATASTWVATPAGRCFATCSDVPIESRAECTTAGETPRAASHVAWYCEAKMLPRTATPSAPPVCRVVSFTAEPTPARPGGSDPMIDSVTGETVTPIPMPYTSRTPNPSANADTIVSDA